MYWLNEFNFKDRDIKVLWEEYAAVAGGFTVLVVLAIIAGAII